MKKRTQLFIIAEKSFINSFNHFFNNTGLRLYQITVITLHVIKERKSLLAQYLQNELQNESQTKKILKLSGIILGALTAVAGILIAVVLNFIFTSEKLTPIVLEAANRNLNAKLDMKSVELTFFSTFPRFGVQLTDGTLVSKAIRDTLWQRTDTLVSFKRR